MRYWVYDERAKRATGPHLDVVLAGLPGFGPKTKVAPEGTREWRQAQEIAELKPLFAPAK